MKSDKEIADTIANLANETDNEPLQAALLSISGAIGMGEEWVFLLMLQTTDISSLIVSMAAKQHAAKIARGN